MGESKVVGVYVDFIKHSEGCHGSTNDFVLLRQPTMEELEDFMCDMVPKVRIVRIHLGRYSAVAPEWHHDFLRVFTDLALKYRPWQLRWLSQASGSITVEWVEVEDWYYKYVNKVGFKEVPDGDFL